MKTITTLLSSKQAKRKPEESRIDNARLRLIQTVDNGDRKASVFKDGAADEFVVRFFENDKYLGDKADYFTSDRSDANSAARKWVNQAKGASAMATVTEHAGDSCYFRDLAVGDEFTATEGSLKGTKLTKQSDSLAVNPDTKDVVRFYPDAEVQRSGTENAFTDEDSQLADRMLEPLTKAYNDMAAAQFTKPGDGVERMYKSLRADLMAGDISGFMKTWDEFSSKHPDATDLLAEEYFAEATGKQGDGPNNGPTFEDFAKAVGLDQWMEAHKGIGAATADDGSVRFFVEIRLGNDLLTGDSAGTEIARLLREAADDVDGKDLDAVTGEAGVTGLKDANGNNIGLYGVKDTSLVNNGQ